MSTIIRQLLGDLGDAIPAGISGSGGRMQATVDSLTKARDFFDTSHAMGAPQLPGMDRVGPALDEALADDWVTRSFLESRDIRDALRAIAG